MTRSARDWVLLAGNSNRPLAQAVSRALGTPLGACDVERFPDGEISVRLLEPVHRKDVYVVQPTCPPVNDNLVGLLALVDACRRGGANRVTAVVPYFGYARQDKRLGRGEPITASLVAHLMQTAGIDHVVTFDLHTPQIEGFFHCSVDSLTAVPILCQPLRKLLPPGSVVVAPDAGRVNMATDYASQLDTSVVVLHKRRDSATETSVTYVVGDVRVRPCLLVDDMISTGGTIAKSIEALLAAGARPEIVVAATHGLLLEGAWEKLSHPAVREIFVTDTVPVMPRPRLHIVSVAPLLAAAIRRLLTDPSPATRALNLRNIETNYRSMHHGIDESRTHQ